MFVRANAGYDLGKRIRLNSDIKVLAGTMKRGSIVKVVEGADNRGEYMVEDENGDRVGFIPSWCAHECLD